MDRLEAAYIAGGSMTSLAEEFGLHPTTIRKWLTRRGTPMRRRGGQNRQWDAAEVDTVCRLYESGQSQTAIGERIGASQNTVSRMLRSRGIVSERPSGPAHASWKGGRISMGAYVGVLVPPDSPFAAMRNSVGYAAEHRFVMAQALGRPLERHETVHHINGDTRDNRLGNLQLRQGQHGHGIVMRCDDCGSDNVRPYELD
jgi:lambda repressor-like predicted transcriptional regulator